MTSLSKVTFSEPDYSYYYEEEAFNETNSKYVYVREEDGGVAEEQEDGGYFGEYGDGGSVGAECHAADRKAASAVVYYCHKSILQVCRH